VRQQYEGSKEKPFNLATSQRSYGTEESKQLILQE